MADEEFERARQRSSRLRASRHCLRPTPSRSGPGARLLCTQRPRTWSMHSAGGLRCRGSRPNSLSFTARHDSGDAAFAERTLDRMEELRLRLEDRFERCPRRSHRRRPHQPGAALHGAPVPAGRALVGGPGRAPLPRRLGDGDRAARPQRPPHGTPRRRRRLARGASRHRRAALRPARGRRQQPDLPPSWTPRRFAPLPRLGLAGGGRPPSTSRARSASTAPR